MTAFGLFRPAHDETPPLRFDRQIKQIGWPGTRNAALSVRFDVRTEARTMVDRRTCIEMRHARNYRN
jgi:hypothetical protein